MVKAKRECNRCEHALRVVLIAAFRRARGLPESSAPGPGHYQVADSFHWARRQVVAKNEVLPRSQAGTGPFLSTRTRFGGLWLSSEESKRINERAPGPGGYDPPPGGVRDIEYETHRILKDTPPRSHSMFSSRYCVS